MVYRMCEGEPKDEFRELHDCTSFAQYKNGLVLAIDDFANFICDPTLAGLPTSEEIENMGPEELPFIASMYDDEF